MNEKITFDHRWKQLLLCVGGGIPTAICFTGRGALWGFYLLLSFSLVANTHAEITLDGTLGGSAGILTDPDNDGDFAIKARWGEQKGGNLFHSFGKFNLDRGQSATFLGPDTVDNVISRVTGGESSNIDGLLRCSIPDADMYFLNPAGVIFGPNASLDIQGSLHVSTADYLRLGENGQFSATNPEGSKLTMAEPSAFGFLSESPAGISKKGGFLEMQPEKTLSFIGGNLNLENEPSAAGGSTTGVIYAPGGQVNLISAASSGEVPANPEKMPDNAFERFGAITIADSLVKAGDSMRLSGNMDISPNEGSKIYIQGGQIFLNNAQISADTLGEGQGIAIKAADELALDRTTISADNLHNNIFERGDGDTDNIAITARRIALTGGSQIVSNTQLAGSSGNISLSATEDIVISGYSSASGMRHSSGITANTSGIGKGGRIHVHASDLSLDDGGSVRTDTAGIGDAGDISVDVERFSLTGGGQINSNTDKASFRVGNVGELTVTAGKKILIEGKSSDGISSGLYSNISISGKGGNVQINTPQMIIQNGGTITTSSSNKGQGGNIEINVDKLTIGQSTIHGDGGNILIDAAVIVSNNKAPLGQNERVFPINYNTEFIGVEESGLKYNSISRINTADDKQIVRLLSSKLATEACTTRPTRFSGRFIIRHDIDGKQNIPAFPNELRASPFYGEFSAPPAEETDSLYQGQKFILQKAVTQAVQHWKTTLNQIEPKAPEDADVLIYLTNAYQAAGQYEPASHTLQSALRAAEYNGTSEQQAQVLRYLTDISSLVVQRPEKVRTYIENSIAHARTQNTPLVLARLLNNLANVLAVQKLYAEALENYVESARLARQHKDAILLARAQANQARLHVRQGDGTLAMRILKQAFVYLKQQPDSRAKGTELLALGQLSLYIKKHFPQTGLENFAVQTLADALRLAETYEDKHMTAYAQGYLGQAYEHARQHAEALQLIDSAIFLSQEQPSALYQWEWQRARILKARQDLAGSARAYRRSLHYLEQIRIAMTSGRYDTREVFNEFIRPVYSGLTDVLLQQAMAAGLPGEKEKLLNEARHVYEQIKAVELQEHFQDECLSADRAVHRPGAALADDQAAILYPVLFHDRIELLLISPDGSMDQIRVPVSSAVVEKEAKKFRKKLENFNPEEISLSAEYDFLPHAQKLHSWLIEPVSGILADRGISTIVVVPSGILYSIPFAALHDGGEFLIQRYAVAITPGLNLMDSGRRLSGRHNILAAGLSESTQNFPVLPYVGEEVESIEMIFGDNSTVLLNQGFSNEGIMRALKKESYSILHIASHSHFDKDPKRSFLLSYDSRLTMDSLEHLLKFNPYRENPVELLVLSASQAIPEESDSPLGWAELGLAGVAVKAGVPSALASLWNVSDAPTARLMAEFYRQLLENPGSSKAQALREAQVQVLTDYEHPYFWAAFMLIGNWL
ncbi:MAG: CHAT domain-containing protein [Gammaproteobacteria bacterium]|nr:CHAT domain-containing protein [Gammaproteobacteria bacterium]